ncbi:MAG: methionine ABC transporter ATP-binding protein [Bacilli bacterium]|nr:methionine ABC transporter ATP-binding protein [Acholeplasmataceae bacterium]MDY2902521.1 methionine ABC transporter ATP-binding protein [Bacilli bacterium]
MEKILEIKKLKKQFKDNIILNDINLEVTKQDIYGILGLSGAGKSTLIRCICGLEKINDGEILFEGKKVNFDSSYHRNVSMIFQSFNLLDQRTVLKNVEIAGELIHDKNRKEKALKFLEVVGLKEKINEYPSSLSGGEKQRVAIARALMTNPKILLCDEATSALDPETTSQILELLKKLNKKYDLTIIMISHQINVIEQICNKVAILDHAKIVEKGNIQDVFMMPKTDIAKKIIYKGHINTDLSAGKFIKIFFHGEIDSPIVAEMIHECNVIVSIIFADSRVVDNKIYGQLVLKVPNDISYQKILAYLKLKGIDYEEVINYEFK